MESDRIVRFTSGIFQPTVLLQTDISTTGQDGQTHLTHHRTELLDLRSIEAKVNHEIGKRNLSSNVIHSNNDVSTIRQRKGQGGNPISSISSSIGSSGNASSYMLPNTVRKRNTSQEHHRSSSQQHHNVISGDSNAILVGNSPPSNSSSSSPSTSQVNTGNSSSHISVQKEVIREQNASTWKIFTTRGLITMVINVMTWPYLLYKFWSSSTAQNIEITNAEENQKFSDDQEDRATVNDSNRDLHENKESHILGLSGTSTKMNKKKGKGSGTLTNNSKKKIPGVNLSTKILPTCTQSLDDVETSSTTTDASNDVDIDIGINSSFSSKVSEIEDPSYEFLPGLLSSTPSGNKKGNKKKKQFQSANSSNSADKEREQPKRNCKGSGNKKEVNCKNSSNNLSLENNSATSSNKEAFKKLQRQEDNNKFSSVNGTEKSCKQQAKIKPNEATMSQNLENEKAGVIASNTNARTVFRGSDASSGGDSTPPPTFSTSSAQSTFGISTNGPLPSGIFSSLDQPLHSNNLVLGQKTKKIPPPVGKILPEIKKPENKGAQYGPVGAKPQLSMPPILSSNMGGMPNKRSSAPWNAELNYNNGSFEATGKSMIQRQISSPVHNGSNSGMSFNNHSNPLTSSPPPMPPPGFSTNHGAGVLHQQKPHLSNSLSIGSATVSPSRRVVAPISNINSNLGGLNNSDVDWNNGLGIESATSQLQQQNDSSNWMIALQEERRRKTEEYLKQRGADWPGFGSGPTTGQGFAISDLWDDPSVASGGERQQQVGRLSTFGLSSFENSSMQHNVQAGGTSGAQSSWTSFNEVWPSSPADPYWSPTSSTSGPRTGTFGSMRGGNLDTDERTLIGSTSSGSSEASAMMRMMNNPSLSSIWSTPSTTSKDPQQNVKSPKNDFSEPPPTTGAIPTSSWPMYQQPNRNS